MTHERTGFDLSLSPLRIFSLKVQFWAAPLAPREDLSNGSGNFSMVLSLCLCFASLSPGSRKSSRSLPEVIQKTRALGNAAFCYGSVWGLSLGEGTFLRGPGEDRALVLLDGCMEWKLGAHEDSATPEISGFSDQC